MGYKPIASTFFALAFTAMGGGDLMASQQLTPSPLAESRRNGKQRQAEPETETNQQSLPEQTVAVQTHAPKPSPLAAHIWGKGSEAQTQSADSRGQQLKE